MGATVCVYSRGEPSNLQAVNTANASPKIADQGKSAHYRRQSVSSFTSLPGSSSDQHLVKSLHSKLRPSSTDEKSTDQSVAMEWNAASASLSTSPRHPKRRFTRETNQSKDSLMSNRSKTKLNPDPSVSAEVNSANQSDASSPTEGRQCFLRQIRLFQHSTFLRSETLSTDGQTWSKTNSSTAR
jgi:hypothetical protein